MGEEADIKDRIIAISKRIPAVERPKEHVHFRTKMMWTFLILLLYFILTNIPVFGMDPTSLDVFASFRAFFAGESGSLMTLGIGPIVTAGIIVQLLVGTQLIKLDLSDPRDQAVFQGMQKILVYVMIVAETLPQLFGGFIRPDTALAASLGIPVWMITALMFIQICIGGVLVLYMDEVVSKWGIGSGVSMFIVAGVSQQLANGLFNFWDTRTVMTSLGQLVIPVGLIPRWIWMAVDPTASAFSRANFLFIMQKGGGELIALLSTLIIFFLVVYFESTRIEIPLAHAAVRGARGRFPVKILYTSNIPIILVGTLQANIQMIGTFLSGRFPFLGRYVDVGGHMVPVSGLFYYLSPINGPEDWIPWLVRSSPEFASLTDLDIMLRLLIYASFLILGSILFAIFWVETTGMSARDVAQKIESSGMQIPGFRRDSVAIEKVMQRYIPKVTIVGGFLLGVLVLIGGLMGTIGGVSPTGLLLSVGIVYRFYEDLARERVMEMHPMIRRFIGVE